MNLIPKKSLGQHFLNSPHVLAQIISAAQIKKGETVLEIGPGTGILTRPLLDSGAKVIAVEKDVRAFEFLKGIFSNEIADGQLELIHGDVLEAPLPLTPNPSPFAIVANIPYYITGAILEKFLEHGPRPDRMVLLVQKEVAERIVARDGKESILSISVKAFGAPKIVAAVPRGAFTPPPTVESAILAIENISDSEFTKGSIDAKKFFTVVRAGFAHKRKFLIRNLESVADRIALERMWQELDLGTKIRAEDVPLEMWFRLAKNIKR